MEKIREPAVSGTFYPAEKRELGQMIDNFLKNAENGNKEDVFAVLAPHPGILYGGPVAGESFKGLPKDIKTVIMLGPSHHFPLQGISLSSYSFFETPLGKAEIKDTMRESFLKDLNFAKKDNSPHLKEHSLEIELLFLQRELGGDFKILPVLAGRMNGDEIEKLSQKLKEVLEEDKKTLIVVSADLSHYHGYNTAVKMDKKCTDAILSLNAGRFMEEYNKGEFEIDAPEAVLALIKLAKELNAEAELLSYKNSGDITGDKTQGVVGYSSMIFRRKK